MQLLVTHRLQLSRDRQVASKRLQGLLTAISPAVERAVDWRRKGPLLMLGYWQTPQAIRNAGAERIEAVLRHARIRTRG
ncbi:hypothetical protein [Allorhizocola rhizosphaerae]|uniref:hypothetical protein n=1 Tax=Allorhizocola rhizosphaerae TaxID=1872709 RepID=UPI0013C2EB5B|nr:hypothetical protein [Allorhizocola rhizosphaerae]